MTMRLYQKRPGDLTWNTARVGMSVRCIRIPEESIWNLGKNLQAISLPVLGMIYSIRSIFQQGICLKGIKNASFNAPQLQGEPYFPFSYFNIISMR